MNEPAAWMYPDDLERFKTSETFAQAYSIEMVSATQGETVPLYLAPQREKPWVELTAQEKQEWIDALPRLPEPRHMMNLLNIMESRLKEANK
jgi:hypothetical protein